MLDYWTLNNRGYAAYETLYMVIGYLKSRQLGIPDCGIPGEEQIGIGELLQFIQDTLEERTRDLDERFPGRAEKT
jgi:hypothetical protein